MTAERYVKEWLGGWCILDTDSEEEGGEVLSLVELDDEIFAEMVAKALNYYKWFKAFVQAVKKMRKAQNYFFKIRRNADRDLVRKAMIDSMELEKDVDALLKQEELL